MVPYTRHSHTATQPHTHTPPQPAEQPLIQYLDGTPSDSGDGACHLDLCHRKANNQKCPKPNFSHVAKNPKEPSQGFEGECLLGTARSQPEGLARVIKNNAKSCNAHACALEMCSLLHVVLLVWALI